MPHPATTLQEAALRLRLGPLSEDSQDHVDLSGARGSNCLARLTAKLMECADNGETTCHLAFIGHRGSGKSTELLRLEKHLSHSFFPVHLFLDSSLEMDADYPEVILWMVEGVAGSLKRENVPFASSHMQAVEKWFCEIAKLETQSTTSTIELETEASAEVGFSFFGLGAKLLAKLKSAIKGSKEYREEVREQVKKSGDELITVVNSFLNAARSALTAAGKPARLLIVQDNLDRLSREGALRVFRDGGETIQRLDAIFVWTPPVGSQLAPFQINRLFQTFYMPMISVKRREGSKNQTAIREFTAVLAARMDLDLLFATAGLVKDLALLSGGSVRELIKLADRARLNARAEQRTQITKADLTAAAKEAAIALQNAFIPNNVYFPILAEISLHKKFEADLDGGFTAEKVDARREFFHRLISEEAVFAYNGDDSWLDVHPVFHVLRDFNEAIAKVPASKPDL
jgi:hypothetical protein